LQFWQGQAPHPACQGSATPQHAAAELPATTPDGSRMGSTVWLRAFGSGGLNSHIELMPGLNASRFSGPVGVKISKQKVCDL